jgi:branched-chain amino acid transport system substrate-binding protein
MPVRSSTHQTRPDGKASSRQGHKRAGERYRQLSAHDYDRRAAPSTHALFREALRTFGRSLLLALGLFVALALSGLAEADQVIAVVEPMTGRQAANGIDFTGGVELAIDDINAKGGLLGQKLTYITVDDACDPDQAEAAAQEIVSEPPAVVIGHYCSSGSVRAAPLYAKAHILQITPTSTSPDLTEMGIDTVFRMLGRDDNQGRTIARRLMAAWPHGRIGVLDDGSLYGKGLADIVRSELKRHSIKPLIDESFPSGAQSYDGIVRRMADAKIEAVFIGSVDLDTAVIAREIAAAKLRIAILAGDALIAPSFWEAAGEAGEAVIFTYPPNPLDLPAGKALIELAQQRGMELGGQAVLTYASVQVWAEAVQQVNSFDPAKVATVLHSSQFPTVIGQVRFDAKGDVLGAPGEWLWYRWRAGKIEHAPDAP